MKPGQTRSRAAPELLSERRGVLTTARRPVRPIPRIAAAYGNLCRCCAWGKSRAPNGECFTHPCRSHRPSRQDAWIVIAVHDTTGGNRRCRVGRDTWLAASMMYNPREARRIKALKPIARGVTLIAVNVAVITIRTARIAGYRHLHS